MTKRAQHSTTKQLIPAGVIERRIFLLRGQKVMLSTDLASLYGVEPRALIQAVKRNPDRFPEDFLFRLDRTEMSILRSQTVILKQGRGRHQKYPPYAFTEQGVAMLSSVLRSKRAALVNVTIMRAFVRLREILATHKDLARKLEQMEGRYDAQFRVVFEALRKLTDPGPGRRSRRVGFLAETLRGGEAAPTGRIR